MKLTHCTIAAALLTLPALCYAAESTQKPTEPHFTEQDYGPGGKYEQFLQDPLTLKGISVATMSRQDIEHLQKQYQNYQADAQKIVDYANSQPQSSDSPFPFITARLALAQVGYEKVLKECNQALKSTEHKEKTSKE